MRAHSGDLETVTIDLIGSGTTAYSPSEKSESESSSTPVAIEDSGENSATGSYHLHVSGISSQHFDQKKSIDCCSESAPSSTTKTDSITTEQPNPTAELPITDAPNGPAPAGSITRSIRRGSWSSTQPTKTSAQQHQIFLAQQFFENLRALGNAGEQEILCRIISSRVICADGWVMSKTLANEWIRWSSLGFAPTVWPVNTVQLERRGPEF